MEAKEDELKYNKFLTRFPDAGKYSRDAYKIHVDFLNASKQYNQRAFLGGNRTGKTETAAYEMTAHLTGIYPHWWRGLKFLNGITAWAAGVTNIDTRDVIQLALFGPINDIGSGMIPKDKIKRINMKSGVVGAIDSAEIEHASGDISIIRLKSYEQRRQGFQGAKIQVVWLDEEPVTDPKIYEECLMRLTDEFRPGIILCTFTPLSGLSETAMAFVPDLIAKGPCLHNSDMYAVQVSWDDVPHLTEKDKKTMWDGCSPHQRLARSKGIPSLGSGAIYPYFEDEVTCKPFPIPSWWPKAYGMDTGWHRTAAVWGAQDPDTKIIYLYSEHYLADSLPPIHASAIKQRGAWMWGASDPAGANLSDGKKIFEIYLEEGLNLIKADKTNREGGILKVGQLLASGQIKIFTSLNHLLDEYRKYRRDDKGEIVKKNDHLMDAMRYLITTGLQYLSLPEDSDSNDYISESRDRYTGY